MTSIRLTAFSGEQPRLIPRLMPENAAQAAHDVRLDDGGLTPIREVTAAGEVPTDVENPKTIYRWKDRWLGWNNVVDATPGPVAQDRLYYTGNGVPKLLIEPETPTVGGVTDPTTYNLAVPRPATKLTAALVGSATDPSNYKYSRLYVYTWVTAFGEESEPSPASLPIDWAFGQTVNLTGWLAVPPPDRNIVKQRIYRSQTGTQGTFYYFIAERVASDLSTYNDAIPVDQFQEPLPAMDYNAPPNGLTGLIAMPGGMMAAYVGKKIYFCEPYQPHAWPEKYVLTVEHAIVALGAMGTTVVITTVAHPYLAAGTHPSSMTLVKLEQNLPCINARSRVDLGYAVAYASNEGLVMVQSNGSIGVVSSNLFNRDGWLVYSPSTIIGCQIAGRYVGFYSALQEDGITYKTGALIIDLASPVFLVHTDTRAVACYYEIETSALFYVPPSSSAVMRLDSPFAIRRKLYWKSKPFILPQPENFGAFLVEATATRTDAEQLAFDNAVVAAKAANVALNAGPTIQGDIDSVPFNVHEMNGDILNPLPQDLMQLNVGIYADKKLVASVNDTNRALRLPSGFTARTWEIDVATNMQVTRIAMTKSMDELKVTP